ncbi:uncharacterized protein LOC113353735 [Papaver somniferum]|uniref:uncharacterized protein LOC113353735 n=1 Tax=Papaver somniferum TaxID=3469 RepID=UPI000E70370F|nr:uncharacterized protein LOC113353735 [Papaver somniferum]
MRQRTQIDSFQSNGGIWLDDRNSIEDELLRHFYSMSRTTNPPKPTDYLNNLNASISEADNAMLTATHNADEKTKAHDGCAAVKLDMSKAFDGVKWGFLIDNLRKLGFSDVWCNMIEQCISTVTTSILLNGSLARTKDASNLSSLIDHFSKFSGQAINFDKSALAFSIKVPNNVKNDIANILRIRKTSLNEKYLGVPLLLQKRKYGSFVHLLDNFRDRLDIWQAIFLVGPGKTIITQFVLGSLASHHLDVFPMPRELTKKMENIQMRFWWGKKENEKGYFMKGWDDIALPKELGGLSIRRTDLLNLALLTKLAWRMINNPEEPWDVILREKYFSVCNPLTYIVNKHGSWIWQGICTCLSVVRKHYVLETGDGKSVKIWKYTWILNMHGPPSHLNYSSGMTHVSQLIDDEQKSWKTDVFTTLFDSNIVKEITNIRIPFSGKDKLKWEPSRNGNFTIKSSYNATLNENLVTKPTKNNLNIYWKAFWKRKLPPRAYQRILNPPTVNHWIPPVTDICKINFDASFIENNTLSGWGLICRDFAGNNNGLREGACIATDPEKDEAISLLEVVLWTKINGWKKIHLEGDCSNVIHAINGRSCAVKWTSLNVVNDALSILKTFDSWSCTYAHRDANHLDDSLEKFTRAHSICFSWFNNMHVWVETLLQQDKNNM